MITSISLMTHHWFNALKHNDNMKEEDLEAIYAYLHSLNPINHQVVRYEKR